MVPFQLSKVKSVSDIRCSQAPASDIPTPTSSFTTSSLGRVRPSTVVRPFFAAQHQPTVNTDAQRRRYPASQPSTPVRGGQPELNQEFQQLHRSARSRHAPGIQSSKSSKSKSYRMENMSIEHLQYLERRLQQLLEILPLRPVLPAKAKSDMGRQPAHPSWVNGAHHHHHQHQALQYPVVATPLHYHPQTTPLLLFPPQSTPQPPPSPPPPASQLPLTHPTASGPSFGEIDPYYLSSSPSSASSCYAGSAPSSLQDFNRDELTCLLHAVRNMLSMHEQNQPSSTSKSTPTLDPLSALQHRPFSWYFHRTAETTSPSSPTSSTVNLFLDEDDSVNVEAADDGIVATDDSEEEEDGKRNNSAADGSPHPPLLPPGFRDFSRYLDSKFGPDSTKDQRSRHHHHHQRRRHRELISNNTTVPVVTTTSTNGGNRGRSVTDVRPKISITTCSGDTGPYSDFVPSSHESFCKTTASTPASSEDNEPTQRLVPTCCTTTSSSSTTTPTTPMPPPQVRYLAPPPPPPNAAAACWFRAAANHFATAAAIFAADNAAAASVLASPYQLPPPFPHPTDPAFVDRPRERRTPAATSSFTLHPQNTPTTSSSTSPSPTLCPPSQFIKDSSIRKNMGEKGDEFSLASDEEDQQQGRRCCQRRLPAVEPLQRQLWGRRGDNLDSPHDGNQAVDDGVCALDMLPQDPALILPDQVDFYAQIKDLLELDSNISLPLPAGWAVGVSSSGRRFYVSCTTGDGGSSCGGERSASSRNRARTTTWQHPIIAPRIPLGWERVEMRRGNCVYYRHLLIPHTQRHHPDLWFPTSPKNVDFEQQSWFFDLRKLQESVPNFDKGNSQLIESYVNTRDSSEEAHFTALLKQHDAGQLEKLLKHLDCRFFRDLHRMVVAFEMARIRIVRELFVQHIHRTTASAVSSSPSATDGSVET
ncbi:hypothetical protein TcWFU_005900 [Taenia crassiceps]|uniref:Uncharacterized protein n=1 Tax=Taenia crassiceps TaxID=6207 RepID=A0ABR4QHB1_9CEST